MYYLNTPQSKTSFQQARNIRSFVDKSLLLKKLSRRIRTMDKCICITRPPQFGKTTNANMLAAYYTKGLDSGALFEDLNLSKEDSYREHLNRHNVIQINFGQMPDNCKSYEDYIESIKRKLAEDLKQVYGVSGRPGMDIYDLLNLTGDSFIFILDEWDSIFHKRFLTQDDKKDFLEFLKDLFKDQTYAELVYITGVLPIAKMKSTSTINMFDEYNFMNDIVKQSKSMLQATLAREEVQGKEA